MNFKAQSILVSIVLLFLGTAWLIKEDRLWSEIGNSTVPWFCTALALALLIVLLVCSLRGQAPSDLPWSVVISTILGVAVVLLVGTEVDNETYPFSGIVGTRWELAGFVGLLLGMFLATRPGRRA